MRPTIFHQETIRRMLRHLDITKGIRPDRIPNIISKTCIAQLTTILWRTFLLSFQMRIVPDRWKGAIVQREPKHCKETC